MNTNSATKSERVTRANWCRFSVRKLLVLLLVVAVFISAPFIYRCWKAQTLIETIESQGGEVHLAQGVYLLGQGFAVPPTVYQMLGRMNSFSMPGSQTEPVDDTFIESLGHQPYLNGVTLGNTRHPTWITDRGIIALAKYPLYTLQMTGGSIHNQGMQALTTFPRLNNLLLHAVTIPWDKFDAAAEMKTLENLIISDTRLSETALQKIALIPHLKYLTLKNTEIDQNGVRHLAQLKSLSGLYLIETKISPNALSHLQASDSLIKLHIESSAINDAHLAQIAKLQQLTFLMLPGASITDQGLIPLAQMQYLNRLLIPGTDITDAGISSLIPSESLTHLELTNTQITDKCTESLLQIPRLRRIRVYGTRMSPDAIDRLRVAGIDVYTDSPPYLRDK